jgi:magnesium transporter
MNFQHMPELDVWWSYPLLLGSMFAVALGMTLYFRRRGWIGSRRRRQAGVKGDKPPRRRTESSR